MFEGPAGQLDAVRGSRWSPRGPSGRLLPPRFARGGPVGVPSTTGKRRETVGLHENENALLSTCTRTELLARPW